MTAMRRRDLIKLGALGFVAAGMGARALGRVGSARAQATTGRAKRVVYLFQAGGPSQLELFDPKPGLASLRNTIMPESVLGGRRITTMTSGQEALRVANAMVPFAQYGESGMWFSDYLPHMATVADDICQVKTVYSDAVNHDPATNLMVTGNQLPGKPSIGAWLSYGLGSANDALPSYVTMQSETKGVEFVQPLAKRLWSSAFLPSNHQGVALRPGDRPVLYLDDGMGIEDASRKAMFDAVIAMNTEHYAQVGDPNILRQSASYEVAAAMQNSMVELADLSQEPDSIFEMYGPQSKTPGTYAANCLRARRLLERDVRCVMLLHRGWDAHYNTNKESKMVADDVDQPTAALIKDLKQRGMLEDTLVIWGGEFGRTAYSQGEITDADHGRDHHAYSFPVLLAGGGVQGGLSYGVTDDFSYNVVEKAVHVHDLHATLLHIVGLDQHALTFEHEGRNHKLTDLGGRVLTDLLA